ncbi:MAG TPA: DUF4886 domain-containing protein [Bacteroidia bacterium]
MLRNVLLLILIPVGSLLAQSRKSVLFVGNSYIYTNDLPLLLHNVALSFNDTIEYDSSAPGGHTFQNHCNNSTTLAKIKNRAWDFVVLQAQSQEPSFPPAQVASQTYPYGKALNDSIKKNNTCTEVVYFMTWGRKNGDASNCGFYPPLCTYEGMQSRLRESYMYMAGVNLATCAPVGMAWKKVREDVPAINLYSPDESHPAIHGSYLTACVFYSTLFHRSSVGATFPAGITASEASSLQTIASSIVLDSSAIWHLDSERPSAGFSFAQNNDQFDFTSNVYNTDSVLWDFGDGTTSNMMNPSHTFLPTSGYTVTQVVFNECGSDTSTVVVQPVSIKKTDTRNADYSIAQGSKKINVVSLLNKKFECRVITIEGKTIYKSVSQQNSFTIELEHPGIYVLEIYDETGKLTKKIATD